MPGATQPEIVVGIASAAETEADMIAVPVRGGAAVDDLGDLAALDRAADGAVARARESGEFRAKRRDTFVTELGGPGWRASRLLLIGAATTDAPGTPTTALREAAAVAARLARARRVARLAFVCRGPGEALALGQAVAEGLAVGGFVDRRYKTDGDDDPGPPRAEIVWPGGPPAGARQAVSRGVVVGTSANLTRELANDPSNVLTPSVFAARAVEAVGVAGVKTEVLDAEAIRALRMGLLLGVARGSQEPPRLVVMRHDPPGAPSTPVLGLVGKGVTFDSGGISIKPAAGMERMKSDMSGGAAVIGAMRAIGMLGVPRRVIGVVPMTENMPGGAATKPGDILTSASGTTVEIINTDAEGRLILGDALWYARELGATHLVDVATLTGACVVALGKVASGLFGRPRTWVETLEEASRRAGERVWPLPIFEEYREQLRSEMADLMNSAGRGAGASTAAMFLETFTGGLPWAHLDIAGTAWIEDAREDCAAGATGVMVRTLTELALGDGSW